MTMCPIYRTIWRSCWRQSRPRSRFAFARNEVAAALAALLDQHVLEDVSVEDPPLEEVIADMFSQVGEEQRTDEGGRMTDEARYGVVK